jgi:uncharacterized protein YpmS
MKEFKKKNKFNFWSSPLILVVFFILIIFLSYKVIDLIKKEKETALNRSLAEENYNLSLKRKKDLKGEIVKMETKEGIEEAIRERYLVTWPDEKMVIITEEEELLSEEIEVEKNNFWNWLKRIFEK